MAQYNLKDKIYIIEATHTTYHDCPNCNGARLISYKTIGETRQTYCPTCGGDGKIEVLHKEWNVKDKTYLIDAVRKTMITNKETIFEYSIGYNNNGTNWYNENWCFKKIEDAKIECDRLNNLKRK